MLLTIIGATFLISLVSLISILIIPKKATERKNLRPLISLAAGALLGVAFLDLIPEAIEGAVGLFEPHLVSTVILLSLLAFFVLERILHWHHCHDDYHGDIHDHRHSVAVLNLAGDAIHNLIDGFLIAGAFMLDFQVGLVVTLAVILHEIPQEIFDFSILIYGGFSRLKAILYNVAISLTALTGAITFYFFGENFAHVIPLMAAVAAGNFIYLAVADLIPELYHEKNRAKITMHTVWLLAGVAVIYVVNAFLPHA